MFILLDPTNKHAQEFLIYCKTQDTRRGSKVQHHPRLTPLIIFAEEFFIYLKIQDGRRRSKIKFRLKNNILAWQTYPVHPIGTKFGRIILVDHPRNKHTEEFLTYSKIQDDCCDCHYGKL